MTPEDREAIAEVIRVTVNGKIDRLTEKVDDHNEKHERDMQEVRQHMAEVKPVLDTINGSKMIGNLVKWLAGVAAAFVLIQQLFYK